VRASGVSLVPVSASSRGGGTHSDTERSEMLTVLLLRLAGEHLGEEGDRVDRQVERVDVVLSEVCRVGRE
jgi:hypothetical protein